MVKRRKWGAVLERRCSRVGRWLAGNGVALGGPKNLQRILNLERELVHGEREEESPASGVTGPLLHT